jgi:archaetidylinositol phosphate synthase
LVSSRLKERFEGWVSSAVGPLTSLGVTPNLLTLLGIVASLAAAWCYVNWWVNRLLLPAAGALVLLSGLFDALDGVLARATGRASDVGGFLDSVSDRYSDAIVLSSIVFSGLCSPVWGIAAVVGSLMVSYARARAEAAGVGMAGVGLAERGERMLFLALMTFATYFQYGLLAYGMVFLAVLTHATVLQRAAHFYGETKKG